MRKEKAIKMLKVELLFKQISLFCNFAEYEVVSTENGATDGEKEKSIITTNQTHSTVENLKPDTR